MNDKDSFAVWLSVAMLRAQGDSFGATALKHVAARVASSDSLDNELALAASNQRRPGDMGLEFLAPFLPVVLVHFGRLLWDAYFAALLKKGAEAVAAATIAGVKAHVKRTLSGKSTELSLTDAEASLKKAALAQGLSGEQTARLVESLHNGKLVEAVEAELVDASG